MFPAWLYLACACITSEPALVLSGPNEVYVDRLGPVDAPKVLLEDGTHPMGVIWSLSRDGVARIEGDRVVAEGPGEVEVSAEWEGAKVSWKLVVELATSLSFIDPPPTLRVGESRPVAVRAMLGERSITPSNIEWTASDPAVFRVDAGGTIVGISAGVGYLTARAGGAFAMAQIEVLP